MTQKILILISDAPNGTEKAYNALRLAMQLGKEHEETVTEAYATPPVDTFIFPGQDDLVQ